MAKGEGATPPPGDRDESADLDDHERQKRDFGIVLPRNVVEVPPRQVPVLEKRKKFFDEMFAIYNEIMSPDIPVDFTAQMAGAYLSLDENDRPLFLEHMRQKIEAEGRMCERTIGGTVGQFFVRLMSATHHAAKTKERPFEGRHLPDALLQRLGLTQGSVKMVLTREDGTLMDQAKWVDELVSPKKPKE